MKVLGTQTATSSDVRITQVLNVIVPKWLSLYTLSSETFLNPCQKSWLSESFYYILRNPKFQPEMVSSTLLFQKKNKKNPNRFLFRKSPTAKKLKKAEEILTY